MEQASGTPKKFSFCRNTPMSTPKLTRNINYAAASLKKTASKFLLFPTNNNTPSPHMNRVVKNQQKNINSEKSESLLVITFLYHDIVASLNI